VRRLDDRLANSQVGDGYVGGEAVGLRLSKLSAIEGQLPMDSPESNRRSRPPGPPSGGSLDARFDADVAAESIPIANRVRPWTDRAAGMNPYPHADALHEEAAHDGATV
jgi:hypothetical protein